MRSFSRIFSLLLAVFLGVTSCREERLRFLVPSCSLPPSDKRQADQRRKQEERHHQKQKEKEKQENLERLERYQRAIGDSLRQQQQRLEEFNREHRRRLEAQQQDLRAQEDRDLQRALENSFETHRQEEQRRRQQQEIPSASVAPSSPSPAPVEASPPYTQGQYLTAANLLKALNDRLGRRPSSNEMQQELISKMTISRGLADQLINELGL